MGTVIFCICWVVVLAALSWAAATADRNYQLNKRKRKRFCPFCGQKFPQEN